MSPDDKARLHAELLALKQRVDDARAGNGEWPENICHHFSEDKLAWQARLVFAKWPGFNGNELYPVGNGECDFDDADTALQFGGIRDAFWSGDYGAKRYSLLEFCIRETAP